MSFKDVIVGEGLRDGHVSLILLKLEENKVPEHCLRKPERWQGQSNINKGKQYKLVLSFKIRLFKSREFVCLAV